MVRFSVWIAAFAAKAGALRLTSINLTITVGQRAAPFTEACGFFAELVFELPGNRKVGEFIDNFFTTLRDEFFDFVEVIWGKHRREGLGKTHSFHVHLKLVRFEGFPYLYRQLCFGE